MSNDRPGRGLALNYGRADPAHLLWAVPAIVVAGGVPFLVSCVSLCGISGCSGGGFGADHGTTWLSFALYIVIGPIAAVILWLAPWDKRGRFRARAGIITGVALAVLLAANATWTLVSHR